MTLFVFFGACLIAFTLLQFRNLSFKETYPLSNTTPNCFAMLPLLNKEGVEGRFVIKIINLKINCYAKTTI
jgi:hypothetical protein